MIAVMNQFSTNTISTARAIYDVLRQSLLQIDIMIRAKLEPYLGFILSMQYGKLSLVCAFQELYRYLIDGFITSHCVESIEILEDSQVKNFIGKNKISDKSRCL